MWLQYRFQTALNNTQVFVYCNIRDGPTEEGRVSGEGGNVLLQWLELIATGNQDVVLETNPNQMNLFKDSSIGFLRATLLREGPISFDFLVACIRSACVINKLTQHLKLLLTQCRLALADWHTAQNLQLSRVTRVFGDKQTGRWPWVQINYCLTASHVLYRPVPV